MKVSYNPADLTRAFDLANRVAPTSKGGAWDMAAGMVMDVDPEGVTTVMATNLDISMQMVFDAEEIKDPPEETKRWRMSSLFLAPFVRKLGATITVTEDRKNNALVFKSRQSKLVVPLMDPANYPTLHQPPGASPTDGGNIANLADRVLWACDTTNKTGPLAGLHADGRNLVGCRHEGMALLEFPFELKEPITFQARELLGLLKGFDDVRVSADESQVFFWVGENDWVSANLIVAPYPKYQRLREVATPTHEVVLTTDAILDCLERMSIIASMDRGDMPKVSMTFTKTKLTMKLFIKGVGDSEESVSIINGPDEPFTIAFSVGMLFDAIRTVENDTFTLAFGNKADPQNGPHSPIKITDGTGWESILMPRRGGTK